MHVKILPELSEVMYKGSVAVHFSCSLSTMEATPLPAPAE